MIAVMVLRPQGLWPRRRLRDMSALLELRNIGMRFGGLRAVDELSFGVEKGQSSA